MSWFEHGPTRIYFEETGAGAPVLLLPGWAMPITDFGPLPARLAAAGRRVISADLPGCGRSQPQPRQYTPSFYDDDARAFLDLLDDLGATPARLVGFSDGGEDALRMAELAPEAVRSVAAWGACGQFVDPDGQMRETIGHLIDRPLPPMTGLRDFLVRQYGEANARAMTRSLAGALTGLVEQRGGDIALAHAGDIACPVLLITGEHDPFATPALVAALADRLPHAQQQVAAGASHGVHHDQPEWLLDQLTTWLAGPGA